MADLKKNLKSAWIKSMEAIGNTASNIASNTRFKVDEMNLQNRRREILSDFGAKAYALWLKGETFPESLTHQLEELQQLDNQLNDLRAERIASNLAKQPGGTGYAADASGTSESPKALEQGKEAETTERTDVSEVSASSMTEPANASVEPAASDENTSQGSAPVIEITGETGKKNAEIAGQEKKKEQKASVDQAINDLFDQATPSVDEMAEKMNQSLDSLHESIQRFSSDQEQQ